MVVLGDCRVDAPSPVRAFQASKRHSQAGCEAEGCVWPGVTMVTDSGRRQSDG